MTSALEVPQAPLPPAPGADEHVSLQLANSAVLMPHEGLVELLPSPEVATQWLVDHALAPLDVELQEYCAGLLKGLRSHLREIFAATVEQREPSRASVIAVNHALTRTPTAQLLGWSPVVGFHTATSHPNTRVVEHALTRIAGDAVALVSGPEGALLATCEAAPCNRFFLRTHSRRQWCSKRCGDRVRAARSYARRRNGASA